MSYALKRYFNPWYRRAIITTYHSSAGEALENLSSAIWDVDWHKAECWHVRPAPMGGKVKKLKLKWKIKRNV